MLDKITILCFAASYLVTLGLEATRFWFRSGVRGALMVGFSTAGLVAHSMYLAALWTKSGVTPLFSEYDWYLSAAWILAVIYFYFLCARPKNSLGLFFLPLVLGLIVVANFLANKQPFATPEGTRILHIAHGVFLLLGTVTVLFAFAAGVMYLVQMSRLKHKRPPRQGLQLPSLEWLAKANTRALHISLVLVLGGFVTGLVLSTLRHGEIHWTDPIVLVSSGMVGWMLISSLFSLIYKPARVGQKVAYLTMASFVFLVLTLAAFLYDSRHGGVDGANSSSRNQSSVTLQERYFGRGQEATWPRQYLRRGDTLVTAQTRRQHAQSPGGRP
ncbi:MAG: cytochrome c biogenesis protein CcsA [Pirellulales bacterium]|nr:cytochrome c biogenesis protein CcsA [Pirellulales bacterium]